MVVLTLLWNSSQWRSLLGVQFLYLPPSLSLRREKRDMAASHTER